MNKILHFVAGALVLIYACQSTNDNVDEKAAKIHDKVLTVDTHCDTPMMLTRKGFDVGKKNDMGRVDFVRMKEGGMDAMFFADFIGQGPRTPEGNEKARVKAMVILDSIYAATKRYSDLARLCFSPDEAYKNQKEGLRSIFIGMENGYPVGNDLSLVKTFYERGVRYITLCHTSNNDICDSSTDPNGPEYNGLSRFGVQVVEEMNQLGMMVDISHTSDSTFYDVIALSKAPVIASHSCARALCDNPRNLTDDMLVKLAGNGGVIQMCILSAYVKTPEPDPARDSALAAVRTQFNNFEGLSDEQMQNARDAYRSVIEKFPRKLATVSDVVDHIDHIVQIAGINHVGIGTDFDGGGGVDGCEDVSQMGNITRELVKRGYTTKQIGKIWGGNLMRVFREVQNKASEKS